MTWILEFGRECWLLLKEMAPFLLLGFGVAGVMSIFLTRGMVVRHLGGKGLWPVIKASLLGVPLPLCSCGVIPVAASIRRQGAGSGAVISFLLSTPQTGVDSLLVTYGLLAPVFGVRFATIFTIFRPIAAFLTGIVGGAIVSAIDADGQKEGIIEPDEAVLDEKPEARQGIRTALVYGFRTLPKDIAKPLLLGIGVSAVVSAVLPEGYFEGSFMDGIWGMLVMMVCGIPIYVCATGSIPVAVSLIAKGVSPGAALTFLISGPATNTATVTTILAMLGRKVTAVYLLVVAGSSLLFGWLMMGLLPNADMDAQLGMAGMVPGWVQVLSVWILAVLFVRALWPAKKEPATKSCCSAD